MSQRDDLIRVLQESNKALSKQKLAEAITGDPNTAGNYSTALKKLCDDKIVERKKFGKMYLYFLTEKGNECILPQVELKKEIDKTTNSTEKPKIKLEELVLRILMSVDDNALSEKDICSIVSKNYLDKYDIRGNKLSTALNKLLGDDFISVSKNDQLKCYSFNPKSILIVYKDATPKSIDPIATLNNYKGFLERLYMHKVGNNLNLEELKHISGLDLTANGKNKKVEFQQHIELKEKLHDIINVDNCEKIFDLCG